MENHVTSNSELLQRARQYDLQAIAEIYDTYSLRLYRYAVRLLGSQDLAEDCIAETFTRFLQALQAGHGPDDFVQAYLFRMAHNWITNFYQREPMPAKELGEEQEDKQIGTEEKVEQRHRLDCIRAALQKLTSDQRQVIVLKYLEGWQHEEIAKIIKKPLGAVKSLQHRALASLERILESEDLI
jgi:RNA polymerase sigma-70 factor (ECF subfamily)